MKYLGVEYYIAQGVEVGTWKFSTSMNDKIRTLRAKSRQEAAEAVERRIQSEKATTYDTRFEVGSQFIPGESGKGVGVRLVL